MATENGIPVEVERMEFEGVRYKAVNTGRHPCFYCQVDGICSKVKCPSLGMSWIEEDPDKDCVKSPDKNVEEIRSLLLLRSEVGLKKYGVTTSENNLTKRQWLRHALEEALDLAVYLQAAINKIDEESK